MNFNPESPHDFAAFSQEYAEFLKVTEPEPEPEPVNPDGNCSDCQPGFACRKHWNKMMVEKYG